MNWFSVLRVRVRQAFHRVQRGSLSPMPQQAAMLAVLLALPSSAVASELLSVGRFSAQELESWQEKRFSEATDYRLVDLAGTTVLAASSSGSASGLVRKIRVDLHKYPYLNWRWRIEERLARRDEKTRPR